MSQSKQNIRLNIAGFMIDIVFHQAESDFDKNLFIKNILQYYNGFSTDNKKQKTDFKIDCIEKKEKRILIKKNSYFTHFYEEKNPNAITESKISGFNR